MIVLELPFYLMLSVLLFYFVSLYFDQTLSIMLPVCALILLFVFMYKLLNDKVKVIMLA